MSTDTETTPPHREPGLAVSLLAAALPGLYLLITSTTTLVSGIWPYDFKRMLQFALLLVLFLLPALNRRIREELGALLPSVPRWIGLTLLGIVAWGVLSAAVNARSAMHLANSLSEVALLTSLVLAVFVVAACRRISGRWFDRIAVGLLALTGLAVGVQELVGVAAAHAANLDFSYDTALQYFSKPRFYNQFQSWTMPAIVALPLLFSSSPLARILCLLALGLHWYVLLMTAGRGTMVGLGATMLFAIVLLPGVRKTLLRWQFAGLILGGAIYAVILFSFENRIEHAPPGLESPTELVATGEDRQSLFLAQSLGRPMANTSGRSWIWSVTLRDAVDNPVLGIGPMNYACTSTYWFGHPHNTPLQILAEWGAPPALGAFFVALALMVSMTRWLRKAALQDGPDAVIAGLLFTGVVAAAVHACFSGVLVMPASQVTGLLVCGTLLGLRMLEDGETRSPARPWLFIPGLVMALLLLSLGSQEIATMEERAAKLPPRIIAPRIWQDSKVCTLYTTQNAVRN